MKCDKIIVTEGPNKEGKFRYCMEWIGNRGPRAQIFHYFLPKGMEAKTEDDRRYDRHIPLTFTWKFGEYLPESGLTKEPNL
jgi:hypothetical protein